MPPGADLDLTLPTHSLPSLADAMDFARDAEAGGYRFLSLSEVTGYNAVALQGALAVETDAVGITSDVVSPYGRSPALLGQTAATLQHLTGGRYRLGLGASSPALAAGWHGRAFDRPVRTLRETIEIVEQVLAGGLVDYTGEQFDLAGLEPEFDAVEPRPPVDVASLGPTSVEMTGRFADGWVPQLFTPDGLCARLEDLERGAELGGRSLEALRVTPTFRCCALEDGERARELARRQLVFMLAAYGPYYRESVAAQGWAEVTETIHERWQAGDKAGANAALPDELMDRLVGAGTPEAVRERVRQFAELEAVDAVRIQFTTGQTREELEATRDALAPGSW